MVAQAVLQLDTISEISFVLIGVTFTYAAYQDLKTREIDDRVWYVAAPIGLVLTLVQAWVTPGYPVFIALFSALMTIALALGIFYIGLYGGADAKALMMLAVTMPVFLNAGADMSPLYPLTVLGNGLVLSLVLIPVLLVVNAAWRLRKGRGSLFEGIKATTAQKVIALFTAIKVKPEIATSIHFNLVETTDANGGRTLKLFNRVEDEDVPKKIPEGAQYVWVTPAIPMIVFFLIGFLLSLAGVDILIRLVATFIQIA
jgi:preflagellin peptidase FlaK